MNNDELLRTIPDESSPWRLLWEMLNSILKPFGLGLIGNTKFSEESGWTKPRYRIGKRIKESRITIRRKYRD